MFRHNLGIQDASRLFLGSSLGSSLCATGGTGELNGAYDGVLGIHQFEAFEVEE